MLLESKRIDNPTISLAKNSTDDLIYLIIAQDVKVRWSEGVVC